MQDRSRPYSNADQYAAVVIGIDGGVVSTGEEFKLAQAVEV